MPTGWNIRSRTTSHLLEQPVEITDGYAFAPDVPGHGLALSERARRELAAPDVLTEDELPPARPGPITLDREDSITALRAS